MRFELFRDLLDYVEHEVDKLIKTGYLTVSTPHAAYLPIVEDITASVMPKDSTDVFVYALQDYKLRRHEYIEKPTSFGVFIRMPQECRVAEMTPLALLRQGIYLEVLYKLVNMINMWQVANKDKEAI